MNKKKILTSIILSSSLIGVITPIPFIVSCGNTVFFKITNNSVNVNFTNLPTSIKKGTKISASYTMPENKVIDEEFTDILINNKSIKNETGVVYKNGILIIPENLITGNLTIKIVAASQFTISNLSSSEITFTNLPDKILEGHQINANYSITGSTVLDVELTQIKVGTQSIKDKTGVKFENNELVIPANFVTDNITIQLIANGEVAVTNTSVGITINNLPNTLLMNHGIDTTYQLNDGNYKFSESDCEIKVGETSIKKASGVVFKNNVLTIPGNLVTNNISIHLHADLYRTIKFKAGEGGTISPTADIEVKDKTTWKQLNDAGKVPTPTPSSSDYSFDNWYTIGGVKLTDDTEITSDLTIEARFNMKEPPAVTSAVVNANPLIAWENNSNYEVTQYYLIPSVTHFNNLPIGYINFEDYFSNNPYATYFYTYSTNTTNKTVTVTNKANSSTAIIDYRRQKITFSDYEKFTDWGNAYGPLSGGCNGGTNYYKCTNGGVTINQYTNESERVVNLNDYNIKLFFYNDVGYLPYEIFINILGINSGFYYALGSNYDYNGQYFVEIKEGVNALTQKAQIKNLTPTEFKSSTYMQYSYDLLALTLDFRFGLIERTRRDNGQKKTYMPNGAYEMLSPYHDDYVKAEDNTSDKAFRNIMKALDDCGHTTITSQNIFATNQIKNYQEIYGDELINVQLNKSNALKTARENSLGSSIEAYKEYEDSTCGKIAYITFDSFTSESGYNDDYPQEDAKGRELPGGTTASNYANDTLRLTMWANEHIQSGNIKNVVIDLSCNGGGVVYAEHFIASWLCGGVTEKIYNPKSNSYCEYTVKADINGDGEFNQQDFLASDVQLYVITTSCSFSCGNMLPTNIQDNRPTNTTFIGTGSGGGACFVDGGLLIGANTNLRISSTNHMLKKSSSYGNYITNDTGCTIDEDWKYDDSTSAGQQALFDRDALNKRIWKK